MKGITILAGLLATGASAHMQMMKPYPIRSPLNKDSDEKKDYSYTNPLQTSGSDYPCKGYANDPFKSQANYSSGQSYELELDGSATHSGGSCQISLTYDRGKTFKVIESMLGDCPIAKNYTFQIPSDAPTGEALLAWTWFNKIGNREMYMNCAMVTIGGSASSGSKSQSSSSNGKNSHGEKVMDDENMTDELMKHMSHMNHPPMEHTMERREMTGESDVSVTMGQSKATAFNSLPDVFLANVGQTGGCVTIEGESVNFPEPGANVLGKIDGSGKGYKCTGNAPFLGSDSSSSATGSSSSTSTSSANSTSSSNSSKSDSKNNNNTSSSQKASKTSDKKPAPTTRSSTTTTSTTTTSSSTTTSTKTTSTTQAMSMVASAFGSPSADPRVLGSQATTVASTNNAFSNYVGQWTCTSGEILCSPDGYTWAMCSNQRPIFMGNVAPGMICRFGQMVAAGF